MSERLSHRMAVEWQNNGRRDAAKNVRIICHGADHAEYNIFCWPWSFIPIKALVYAAAGKCPHAASVQTRAVGFHASDGATEVMREIFHQIRYMSRSFENHHEDDQLQATWVIFCMFGRTRTLVGYALFSEVWWHDDIPMLERSRISWCN